MHPRQILDRYGITPKQSLGQNFLYDEGLLGRIVAAAELSPGDAVLEVGPGLGALTRQLAQVAGRVVAVELDDRLLPVLRYELSPFSHVAIVHADILSFDPAAWFDAPFVVVANVPYYITGAILRHLLEGRPRPRRLVLTVQREVAERLAATPPKMSLLAVSVQYFARPEIVARIPAGAFYPPPKVDSAILRLRPWQQPPVDAPDEEAFFAVARAGFGQRRKQLRNSLRANLNLSQELTDALLHQAGIDPQRRAETLELAEWARLAHAWRAVTGG